MSNIFAGSYESVVGRKTTIEGQWVSRLRASAFEKFCEGGLPTTKMESWKYTNLQGLSRCNFISQSALPTTEKGNPETVIEWMKGLENTSCFVFANGRFVPSLSSALSDARPPHAEESSITTLSQFLGMSENEGISETLRSVVKHSLTNSLDSVDQHFGLLNAALVEDGLVVHARAGVEDKRPLIIFHLTDPLVNRETSLKAGAGETEGALALAPRTIIYAEPNSEISIVEVFSCRTESATSQVYLTAPVTEIVAEEGARVNHLKIQVDSLAAYHLSTMRQRLAANSRVQSAVLNFGSALARNDISATLTGEGANADIKGLTILQGTQHIDNHIAVEHQAPHCDSQQTFRGVFGEASHGVFTGTIVVDRDAQKTNAYQSNRNLLLTDQAAVDSRPQLRIFADDVKCSHGATVGQLDMNGLFYLRSRGVPLLEAQLILAISFSSAVLEHLPIGVFNDRLVDLVRTRLEECFARGCLER